MTRVMSLRQLRVGTGTRTVDLRDRLGAAEGRLWLVERRPLRRMRLATVAEYVGGLGGELYVLVVLPEGRVLALGDALGDDGANAQ